MERKPVEKCVKGEHVKGGMEEEMREPLPQEEAGGHFMNRKPGRIKSEEKCFRVN